jgi:predicted metal-dependent hydrolase
MATEACIDYVVVHELCHREHMDHSKQFWGEVKKILPDYKEREKWLNDNSVNLTL